MSPAVEAALIAGGVGVLTLAGTMFSQFYGIRRTSSNTEKILKQQTEHLDTTLALLCECRVQVLSLLFEYLFSVAAGSANAVELRKHGASQGEDADAASDERSFNSRTHNRNLIQLPAPGTAAAAVMAASPRCPPPARAAVCITPTRTRPRRSALSDARGRRSHRTRPERAGSRTV